MTVRGWRLSQLLALQITLIVILTLAVLAGISAVWVTPQIQADIESGQQDIAHAVADKIQAYLSGAEHELNAIAYFLRKNATADETEIQAILESHLDEPGMFESISVIDARGITLTLALPPERRMEYATYLGVDVSGKPFYRRSRELNRTTWSDTYLSAVTGELSVALAIPVNSTITLLAELSLTHLTGFSSPQAHSSHLQTLLIDKNAQLIAHPDPALTGQQLNLSHLPVVTNGLLQGSSIERFEWQNQSMIGASVVVSELGWLVLVAQRVDHAYRYVWLGSQAVGVASLVALIGALIGALVLGRSMNHKVQRYSDNAHLISQGNYQLTWPGDNIHEFGVLAQHLQQMSDSIQSREQALSDSEASLRALMEQAPNIAIQWFDFEGRLIEINRTAEALFQINKDEVCGRTPGQLFNDEQRQRELQADIEQLRRSNTTLLPSEKQFKRTDGSLITVLHSALLIKDPLRRPCVVTLDTDISAQKAAETQRRQREQRYRILFEQSPVAVIEWDLDFRVQEWNQSAEEIFGYSREQALGQHATFIVPPEYHEMVGGVMELLQSDLGGYRNENPNITASGRMITCQWYNQPILDEQGQVIAVMSSVDDVSERIRMEQRLKSSEQKFIALFQASPVPASVSYYSDSARIINCNDAWLRLFGYSRNDVIGYTSKEVGHWHDTGVLDRLDAQLFEHGSVDNFTAEFVCYGGERITCRVSERLITVNDDRLIISTYLDITQQLAAEHEIRDLNQTLESRVEERTSELQSTLDKLQRAQQELVRAEKLAALGSLVAGVSHELNTPIGNALMAATTFDEHTRVMNRKVADDALKRSDLEQYMSDAEAGCSIVEHNLRKASELVSSFKQVAIDQTSSQRRRFQLLEVVNEITLTIAPSLKKTPYELLLDIPETIHFDSYPGPLGQVLTNLINNALLHGLEGLTQGLIRIEARAPEGQPTVELSVSDNGHGIPLEAQSRIFDPFFTSKLGRGGSGLGLNIVHNLVTQVLGGQIELISAPGEGTRFVLRLPLSAPEADHTAALEQ